MKFSIKDFFSKCDQIRSFLPIWSHLLKKSLMENFFFLCSLVILMQEQKQLLEIMADKKEEMKMKETKDQ